jgi:hypothetical protein
VDIRSVWDQKLVDIFNRRELVECPGKTSSSHTNYKREMLACRFVAVRLKDAEETMRQINQFYIQKAVDAVTGSGWVGL